MAVVLQMQDIRSWLLCGPKFYSKSLFWKLEKGKIKFVNLTNW